MFHRGAKPLTPAEREHLERVRSLGCVCCEKFNVPWLHPVQIHHLVLHNRRMGHAYVLPLCKPHHVGGPFTFYQQLMIPEEARVSIASGSRAFARVYGSEKSLYEGVCRKLGLEAHWPESTKILPRRLA